jgi:Ca-activated chloride channel family protein
MVRLDERYALLNRDFVLSWQRDGQEPTATVQAQPDADGGGGYFTLTIQPPSAVAAADVPGREFVFVVDASGSMSGEPMDLAKATMRRFIEGLGPDDAFQVIRFSESASGLGDELLEVTPHNVTLALEYIDALAGQGGTAMTEGIRASLSMPHRSDRLRYVVFLTDGYIGNEAQIFELVAEQIGDARLFSLGVGSSVNRYLLDGMARMGRGTVTYVDLAQPTRPVVKRIYDKLRQPALVDLELEIEGIEVSDLVPGKLPDLFVGEPVVLFGRYEGTLDGTMTVHGRQGAHEIELPVVLQEVRDEDSEGVRSMWAREQIDELELDPTLAWASQARRDSTKSEVIGLSLEHRVLTQYTAFVAVDHTRVIQGHSNGETIVQGVEIPSGVAHEAVWGQVGQPPLSGDGSGGAGGLGLVGTGHGGGGSGEGTIGLGNTGLIGHGGGSGSGSGYGRGSGVGFGGRGKRVPRVRYAKVTVSGAMDRHVIRRIVRAHHNEVRHCYNQGLLVDPSLAGRVVIQFVIDALGQVSGAVVSKTTVADEKVGQCIARAAKRWKFPKVHDGGVARVTYPFLLSPG